MQKTLQKTMDYDVNSFFHRTCFFRLRSDSLDLFLGKKQKKLKRKRFPSCFDDSSGECSRSRIASISFGEISQKLKNVILSILLLQGSIISIKINNFALTRFKFLGKWSWNFDFTKCLLIQSVKICANIFGFLQNYVTAEQIFSHKCTSARTCFFARIR